MPLSTQGKNHSRLISQPNPRKAFGFFRFEITALESIPTMPKGFLICFNEWVKPEGQGPESVSPSVKKLSKNMAGEFGWTQNQGKARRFTSLSPPNKEFT